MRGSNLIYQNGKGVFTITVNGQTTKVEGNNTNQETVASALNRGAVLTLTNDSGEWTIVMTK